ncbi:MAG: histidine kinase [Chitinophagaceae bacterium]
MRFLVYFIAFLLCSMTAVAQLSVRACDSLLLQANNKLYQFRQSEAMKEYLVVMKAARELQNNSLYARSLLGAGQATWYDGNFRQAADTIELSLQYFGSGDKQSKVFALRILSNIYDDMGDYEKAFAAVQESLVINDRVDRQNRVLSLIQMGKLYKNISDYETARDYYAKAEAENPLKGEYPFRELNHSLGELYLARKQFDSARYFYEQAFIGYARSPLIRMRIGELFLLKNEPDSAREYLLPPYEAALAENNVNTATAALIGLARVDEQKNRLPDAIIKANTALKKAEQLGFFKYRLELYILLSRLYENTGDVSKALYFQKLKASLTETAMSDVFKGKMFAFRQKTLAADQETTLQQLKDGKRLAQQTILIVALLALLIILLLLFRHKNEKLRLKQKATEMEMQALRAQMNPHFMFNCLSAINHFILDNNNEKASDYLTRFSRLMRMVMTNSGKRTITLEEELTMLRLYLDMEQLRFKDVFAYHIDTAPELHPSMIHVPCFILQPFCENAIWHGLLHKQGKGELTITIKQEKGTLIVSIKDNGIGLSKARELKKETRISMGLQLSTERLALFNQQHKKNASFSIAEWKEKDGTTGGTEVILNIKTNTSYNG